MKIMVGYNGGESGERALKLARDYALLTNAVVHIITSMEGGESEKTSDIVNAEKDLNFARDIMQSAGVQFIAKQSVRGLSPGEDIVFYAKENDINHIFLGIKKKSRTQKMIMGSTARFVILKAHCPVTSIK
ncbi:MAG: universal stress protein [Desulfamplus sp.]|nr:universal stress protein [Desulfamplus sp.]MBF0240921.1 universal stress protein [Desulfamplus sp.]MBF0390170.1 universal stress protein [Desulfamplus sp.]